MGHVGPHTDGRAAAQWESPVLLAVRRGAMGHIHRHTKIRCDGKGRGLGPCAGELLSGTAQKVKIDVQRFVQQQFRRPQKRRKAGAVVHRLAAHLPFPQWGAAAPKDDRGAKRNRLHRLLLRHADVHHQLRDGDGFAAVFRLLHMRRQTSHHAEARGIGEHRHLPVGQHPGIDSADGSEAEKALLNADGDEPDLIQVGVQQQLLGVRPAAAAHAHHASAAADGDLVHQGPQQLRGHPGRRSLEAGGRGLGTQALQRLSDIHCFNSLFAVGTAETAVPLYGSS